MKNKEYYWSTLKITWLLVSTVFIVSCIWGEKYLYGDGSHYLYSLLKVNNFVFYPPGRYKTDILTQFFIVAAMKCGVKSIPMLSALYGFGETVWTALFYYLSLIICKKYDMKECGFASLVIGLYSLLFTSFYIQVESIMGLSCFILQLTLLAIGTRDKRTEIIRWLILLLLQLYSFHLNEYFFIWGLVAIVYTLLSIIIRHNRLYYLINAGLYLVISYIGYKDILYSSTVLGYAPNNGDLSAIFSRRGFLLITFVLLASVIAITFIHHKLRHAIVGLTCVLILIWVFTHAEFICLCAVNVRFSNLALGCACAMYLFFLTLFRGKTTFQKQSATILAICLGICTAFSLLSGGIYHRRVDNDYIRYLTKHSGVQRIQRLTSSDLYYEWPLPKHAVMIMAIRGYNSITCIVETDMQVVTASDILSDFDNGYFAHYDISLDIN